MEEGLFAVYVLGVWSYWSYVCEGKGNLLYILVMKGY